MANSASPVCFETVFPTEQNRARLLMLSQPLPVLLFGRRGPG